VLIVDEAQNLTPEAFQVVHALSNMETPTEKLLQIILSGQREIEATLRLPELKPFRQRIAVRLRTCPLSPDETRQYIAHRLHVAGGDMQTIFTPGAVKAVAWSSAGIPRLINLICEHALITGYADQRRPVGAQTVQDVAREFSLAVANLSPEDLAEGVLVPPEPGAIVPPSSEIASPAGPVPLPAPHRVPAEILENPMPIGAETHTGNSALAVLTPQGEGSVTSVTPMIAAKSPAVSQGSAEDAICVPRKAPPPLLLKKVAAGRGFAHIKNVSPQPGRERPGASRWAALVFVLMGLALGGYYLVASGLLTKARRGEPPNSSIQSPNSTLGNPAGT